MYVIVCICASLMGFILTMTVTEYSNISNIDRADTAICVYVYHNHVVYILCILYAT